MKTKFWFTILILIITISVQAQHVNKKIYDADKEKDILIGPVTRDGLLEVEFGDFTAGYDNYEYEAGIISQLKGIGYNYSIVVFIGTWCEDSQDQLPGFYRILDEIGYPDGEISVIALDGKKTCPDVDVVELGIEFVPTFIFYRNREEIGRIVEMPEVSLEADWLSIVQ